MQENLYNSLSANVLRRTLLAAAVLVGTTVAAQAQFIYTPALASNTAGTYTDLGTNGTAIATANTDDANSAATDIGFTFNYSGSSFTQFVLNTNGYIKLGATAPTAPYFYSGPQVTSAGPLQSTTDNFLILPFNTDLTAGSASPTEYRVATSGTAPNRVCTIQWKNVSDKASSIATQYQNLSFQVKLYETSNLIEFVYNTAVAGTGTATYRTVAVGLKNNGLTNDQLLTVTKASGAAWANAVFQSGDYPAPAAGFAPTGHNVRSTVLPDAGRTYRFTPAVANDAAITQLYNIEKLPAGQSYTYSAVVRNLGTTATTATTATLTVSGANSATQTVNIPSIAVGAGGILTFQAIALRTAGTNNVSVALASDGNNNNNTQTAVTTTTTSNTTTASTFSYINPAASFPSSYGFNTSSTGASLTNAFCVAFTPTSAFNVNVVRAQIGNDNTCVGQKVYGVVLDMSGNVLGRSADYTMTAADLGTLHTFTLPTPVNIAANTKFLVGLAQIVEDVAFFPMAYQTETPSRPNTYYIAGLSPAFAPGDITTSSATYNIRYALEAGGFGTTLAMASPALARAISLYPNPSTTGLFTLESASLKAPGGLAVSVFNQLGQVVYRSSATANTTATLDLSGLSAGLYQVRVANGDEFMTRQVAIVK